MPAILKNLSKTHRYARSASVTFGDVSYAPGGLFGPRLQREFQLVAVVAGAATVNVDGVDHALPAGRMALSRPGACENYVFAPRARTRHTWCTVAAERVPPGLAASLGPLPFAAPLSLRMEHLIETGLASPAADSPEDAALVDLLGEAVLREYLCAAAPGHGKAAPRPEPVRRAQEFARTHLGEPLTVADLARAACCSPNHLTKLFRLHLGTTPAQYLWRSRAQRGVELLTRTGLSVSEIADRTGFQNPFHFSRLVRRWYQLPPRELRRQRWNAPGQDPR